MAFANCQYGIVKTKYDYAKAFLVVANTFGHFEIAYEHYEITPEHFVFPFMEIHGHKTCLQRHISALH